MHVRRIALITIILASFVGAELRAQSFGKIERERVQQMLTSIKNEMKKSYYDPQFHGVDLDARFKAASDKVETAASLGHAFAIVAQALLDLDDSHTFFIPPARSTRVEYGWQMQMIGDECFVVAVNPKSDAAAKGLKPGDKLLKIESFVPRRSELWKLEYLYYTLSPRPSLKVTAQSPDGGPRELELAAKVTQGKRVLDVTNEADVDAMVRDFDNDARLHRHRYLKVGDVAIWKMPAFDIDPGEVDGAMDEVLKGASSLIIDMRSNGGGYVKTLEQVAGRFFDHDVKIADMKGRKATKPSMAKKRKTPFTGKLVLLIDSNSASAAELLARLMQIEKRGVVMGDRSSGSVMQSEHFDLSMGVERVIMYSASITDADVIMTDGKSLEHVGVTPDDLLVPSANDLAAGRDPVLAKALASLGANVDPAAAGALFPIEWK